MELLVIILNREEHLETVVSVLVELGVSGATILDSQGLGQFLAFEVPIFAGLKQLLGERKGPSKTILALIEDSTFVDGLRRMLLEESIDLTEPGTGVLFTVPVSRVIRSEEEDLKE